MIYVFEGHSLDSTRRELRRGTEVVAVEPRVFDLLEYFVRNRDRVVSKDDLISAVWRGRIVSDSAITSRINAVRQAIGDSGREQRLIRTVARRGHRFIGEVKQAENLTRTRSAEHGGPNVESSSPTGHGVTFCKTKDGVSLAVASVGLGPPLVRAALWATSIEYDWQNPATGPLLHIFLVVSESPVTTAGARDCPIGTLQPFRSIPCLKISRLWSILADSNGSH